MIWVPAYAIYYVLAMPGTVKEVSEFSLVSVVLQKVQGKDLVSSTVLCMKILSTGRSQTRIFYSALSELHFNLLKY